MLIAFSLAGTLLGREPWKNAHQDWFDRMATRLEDAGLASWSEREDYFSGVDEVMLRRMPDASDGERTRQARTEYFDLVSDNLSSDDIRDDIVALVRDLAATNRIGVITTTLEPVAAKAIRLAELQEVVTALAASEAAERDAKLPVFARFIGLYGKPALYVGGGREDVRTFCEQEGIPYVSTEEHRTVEDLRSAIHASLSGQ